MFHPAFDTECHRQTMLTWNILFCCNSRRLKTQAKTNRTINLHHHHLLRWDRRRNPSQRGFLFPPFSLGWGTPQQGESLSQIVGREIKQRRADSSNSSRRVRQERGGRGKKRETRRGRELQVAWVRGPGGEGPEAAGSTVARASAAKVRGQKKARKQKSEFMFCDSPPPSPLRGSDRNK